MLKRLILIPFAVLICLVGSALIYDFVTFDRVLAKRDYERIKSGMAGYYANLDWMTEYRGMDLVALDRETSTRFDSASTRMQAYLALWDFVSAFDDPHLQLKWGQAPAQIAVKDSEFSSVGNAPPATSGSGIPDCESAGYVQDISGTELAYPSHPDFRPLADAPFPAGVIGTTGFVRIGIFREADYLTNCQAAWAPGLDARGLQLATRAHLNQAMRDLLAVMRTEGVTQLAIDITGNGGGTEWSTELAMLFAGGKLTRAEVKVIDPQCNRTPIWKGENVCSVFNGSSGTESREGEGQWDSPIVLLVDRNSASAAEGFAVWLHGNNRARLVGERTLGAGCGYISGGNAVQLTSASLHLMIPNCSRFTAAGINEIEGLEPDVQLDLPNAEPSAFTALFPRNR